MREETFIYIMVDSLNKDKRKNKSYSIRRENKENF